MSAKQRVKLAALWSMRAIGLFALARWLTRRQFAIIGWHGVSILDEHRDQPNYFLAPETLRQRLVFLNKHFRIVSLETLVEQHAQGTIQPRQVALTFDDAMYDFRESAMPILKEFSAPATVYVVSSTLDAPTRADMLMLRHTILSSRLSHSPEGLPELPVPMPLSTEDERFDCLRELRQAIFKLPQEGPERPEYVDRMMAAFEVDLSEKVRRRVWDYMTNDEVQATAVDGYSMQPHSHLHRFCPEILDELAEDTRICKERLEKTTGQPAVDYCYPAGRWNRAAAKIIAEEGMRSGVTCGAGLNSPRTPIHSLKRFVTGDDFSQLEFEFAVSGLQSLIHYFTKPALRNEPPEVGGSSADAPRDS